MLIIVALAALAADILSKTAVVATLQDEEPIELLGGLLKLRETRNSGAAFSIGTGYTIVFTLIACGVVVAILRTARNLRSLPWAICLGLLLGGAIGNLIDRIFRAPAPFKGHVVDWIQVPHFPVFNMADSAIVCGGFLAVALAARGLQIDGTRLTGDGDPDPEPEEPASGDAPAEAAADPPAKDADAPAVPADAPADPPADASADTSAEVTAKDAAKGAPEESGEKS
ncbi:signal peptidase II [Actinomadura graeca]|uniref:signal peptidase II n=1 Tax=Actinomadura graeca TaxID=2750812 RepID=UPI001E3815F3|nr:signal peptidase II [Actinomadura graeca]